jgi:putative transposase
MSGTTWLQTTLPIRLLPTPAQAALLRAHGREYISTINVLMAAIESGVVPDDGKDTTTADFTAALPSAVKNQTLRDARSVWKRALTLGRVPVLRRPVCQWNNQNWRIERAPDGNGDVLLIPVHQNGQVERIAIRCMTGALANLPAGSTPGVLRITRKRGKWIADVAYTLPRCAECSSGCGRDGRRPGHQGARRHPRRRPGHALPGQRRDAKCPPPAVLCPA